MSKGCLSNPDTFLECPVQIWCNQKNDEANAYLRPWSSQLYRAHKALCSLEALLKHPETNPASTVSLRQEYDRIQADIHGIVNPARDMRPNIDLDRVSHSCIEGVEQEIVGENIILLCGSLALNEEDRQKYVQVKSIEN